MNEESESKEIVNWEDKLAAQALEAAAVERPAVSKISLRAGIMAYMGTPVTDNKLPCIVLASCIEQTLYKEKFDADKPSNPDCFALGPLGSEELLTPDPSVPNPRSDFCKDCPEYKWGSGRGRGKACATRRRLALIPASALENPDKLQGAEIAVLGVPVTSVKNWGTYVNALSAQYQRPPWAMVTQVMVIPDAKTQFKVKFEPLAMIDSTLLGTLEGMIDFANTVIMTPYDMSGSADEEEEGEADTKY